MSQDLLDIQVIEEVRSVVEERYDLMLEKYQENGRDCLVRIKNAQAEKDWKELRFAVHSLKTSAATMGMRYLSGKAAELELLLQDYLDRGVPFKEGAADLLVQTVAELYVVSLQSLLAYVGKR